MTTPIDTHDMPATPAPFNERDRLPFVREGLATLTVFSTIIFLAVAVLGWGVLAAVGLLIAWFFLNLQRVSPDDPAAIVSPADGTVVEVSELEHDEYIGDPAVQVGA